MINTNINKKIREKLEELAVTPKEIKMCEQLLMRELRWYNMEYPRFKAEFIQLLSNYFPFDEDDK